MLQVNLAPELFRFQHIKLFAYLDKGSDALVKMCFLVPCRDLHTDACLIFRHYRIIETCHIDTLLLHTCSVNLGQLRVIQHNGTDSALCRFDIKSGSRHLIAEVVYILNKFIM